MGLNNDETENYQKFVEKFKPKKTTDDCYTPPGVFEVIKQWAIKEYKLKDRPIVRPFYPGGDYEKFLYPKNCVVLDHPPFSILKEIKSFYLKNNIDFFLFAPALTLFTSDFQSVNYIICNSGITYKNGAKVNTGFVTNLGNDFITISPKLNKIIKEVQENKNPRLKYKYPKNVITSAILNKYCNLGIEIKFKREECHFIRSLESQRKFKKELYGSGFLISNRAAKILSDCENLKKEKNKIEWELSKKEYEIIKNLNKTG